jgi:hypothetical protein
MTARQLQIYFFFGAAGLLGLAAAAGFFGAGFASFLMWWLICVPPLPRRWRTEIGQAILARLLDR